MEWEERVRGGLGSWVPDTVLDTVDVDQLDKNQAADIAMKLDPKVFGEFSRAKKESSFMLNRTEFRRILNNWAAMTDDFADDTKPVKRLITILRDPDVKLMPLASTIEKGEQKIQGSQNMKGKLHHLSEAI